LGTEEDRAKARYIMTKVADTCVEYLQWGDQLDKEQRKGAQSTLQHQQAVFGYVLQQMERRGDAELVDRYYPIYSAHAL